MKRRLLAMCVIVALAALACDYSGPAIPSVPTPTLVPLPPGAIVLEVDIEDFTHQNLEIQVGETIIWTNRYSGFHTVTHIPTKIGEELEWVSSKNIDPGDSFRHTFNNAGTFKYICEIHVATMSATVTVVETSGS